MPPIIYNLFPTLVGPPPEWIPHAERARRMGFNWLYLNPFHYPGFSGSLYAIKEYDRLHPLLDPAGSGAGLAPLAPVVRSIREQGLRVMMDLVINHTAKDNPLVAAHPGWFCRDARGAVVSPSAVDPDDPTKVTVWGDLAEIDNLGAEDREGLWTFWESHVGRALDLGFSGFRCDAAYKVPAALWTRLIGRAKERDREVIFLAETLGCTVEETADLASAGFDYFYNSSKWWDFLAPWCLDQHEQFRTVAPSVSFPESHDTPRLAAETGGNEAIQRQRYAFAATFSAGLQMPVGYEFGFRRDLDVVKTRPSDWESPIFDLSGFIGRVNALKATHPLLAGEGVLRALDAGVEDVTMIERRSDDAGSHWGLILVNRDAAAACEVRLDARRPRDGARLLRLCCDEAPGDGEPLRGPVRLGPAEVVLVLGGRRPWKS